MKNAFLDVNGVLTSYGYAESNNDDVLLAVPDDFDLQPGKWRYDDGKWVEYVAPQTIEQVLAERSSRLAAATREIGPLQDLIDLGESSPEDEDKLTEWKTYRAAVSKVQTQAGYPGSVVWPQEPAL